MDRAYWEPQSDITVWELALCLGVLLPAAGGAAINLSELVDKLPHAARRHFRSSASGGGADRELAREGYELGLHDGRAQARAELEAMPLEMPTTEELAEMRNKRAVYVVGNATNRNEE